MLTTRGHFGRGHSGAGGRGRLRRIAAAAVLGPACALSAARGEEPASTAASVTEKPASQQELMTARGFVRYRGMWRTVQEIELIERADRVRLAQKEWDARLERLRKRLDDPRQAAAAAEELREIADPFAVPALAAALGKERMPRVRAYYVESLSHIRGQESLVALVSVAVDHPDPETRILAVERLVDIGPDIAAAAIVGALGGGDNARIHRAAEALGQRGSKVAVAPLVDVLETDHVGVVGGGAAEGSTTATFTPSGGGLSMGSGPKRQKTRVQNQQVLEALVRLTSVNFEWNTAAWRAWLANRESPPDFDPRRG
ncbi:MAG: HEAT repeat domain-containing protein [Planctomycetia bacterium]